MAGVEYERVLQLHSQKLADTLLQVSMQQAYSEQLEKQIASLQERVRELEGESVGMVNGPGEQETAWHPDREPSSL